MKVVYYLTILVIYASTGYSIICHKCFGPSQGKCDNASNIEDWQVCPRIHKSMIFFEGERTRKNVCFKTITPASTYPDQNLTSKEPFINRGCGVDGPERFDTCTHLRAFTKGLKCWSCDDTDYCNDSTVKISCAFLLSFSVLVAFLMNRFT